MCQTLKAQQLIDSRSFYLGFTYQPYDWSDQAFEDTYSFIDKNSDMIFHYFDAGVPWKEASTESKYHSSVDLEFNNRLKHKRKNQKVTIGVNFLAGDRRSLAPYWGKQDNTPLTGKWAKRGVAHPEVISSYVTYCRSMISRFKPDYFIYGM